MNCNRLVLSLFTLSLAACSQQTPHSQEITPQGITTQNWTATVVSGQTLLKNNGTVVTLKGINWYGLDGSQQMGGTWTSDVLNGSTRTHDLDFWFSRIKALGFNAIRVPLSADTIWNNATGSNTMLNTVVQKANSYNMYVLLGYQTCSPSYLGGNLVGDPSTCPDRTWDLGSWLYYMEKLAQVAKNNPNVIGIDVFNEPHKLGWSTWKGYAEQAVTRMEQTYSTLTGRNILYFVEGSGGTPNWGADISGASTASGRLFSGGGVNQQIVYSPHFYGKWVTASNATSIVSNVVNSGAPVVIGEFGMVPDTSSTATGGTVWGANFINGVKGKSPSFFYWAWNANEYDGPYGILRKETNGNSNWCIAEYDIVQTLKNNYGLSITAPYTHTVCY
ncbi:glycoside hydrolase family 5 protein [Deinococcus roseus]|uniref:cellulase n=1 Tax=Deinococcus roseus TaxID=392414 RepID=A0ABQ2D0A2_9DEIO|nr:cellulase family glycosylhydrolase [Deinococcus roseus]GGJ33973.1 hypothetical protein GCM10008938_20210 [Deinococcus roseus]